MIYLTGDTHKALDISKVFDKTKHLNKNDYLIILGDFGLPFYNSDISDEILENPRMIKEREIYHSLIHQLSLLPFTILFIDGNHDNHPFWYKQSVTELFGGKVQIHPHANNIYHLMRGEYYTIEGHTFFCMGGANTRDKSYRKLNFDYWKEEIPKQSEMIHGIRMLQMHNNKVDFVLTHCMPYSFIDPILHQTHHNNLATAYLDEINQSITYHYWFCGHYHQDLNRPDYKFQIIYNNIVSLEDYL